MALSTKVGSFAIPASTGNNPVTGVGFQPKVVLFWSNNQTSDGSTGNNTQNALMPASLLGVGISSSSMCVVADADDFTSGNPHFDTTRCLSVLASTSGTVRYQATFVSLDSDGFTVNFTSVTSGAIVNYMALGGSDLTNVALASVTPASGNVPVTGVGFQPDALILLGGQTLNSTSYAGIGFANATGSGSFSTGYNAGIGVYQRTGKAFVEVSGNSGTPIKNEATLVSLDSDGFTLNFTTATSASHNMRVLCLKGAKFAVGSITQPTSPGTQPTSGLGFQPSALLLGSDQHAAATTVQIDRLQMAIGGTDGTNQSIVASADNSFGVNVLSRTKVWQTVTDAATPAVSADAAISSFDSDGFTLNFTTADATARQILYFAIGPASAPSALPPSLQDPWRPPPVLPVSPSWQGR